MLDYLIRSFKTSLIITIFTFINLYNISILFAQNKPKIGIFDIKKASKTSSTDRDTIISYIKQIVEKRQIYQVDDLTKVSKNDFYQPGLTRKKGISDFANEFSLDSVLKGSLVKKDEMYILELELIKFVDGKESNTLSGKHSIPLSDDLEKLTLEVLIQIGLAEKEIVNEVPKKPNITEKSKQSSFKIPIGIHVQTVIFSPITMSDWYNNSLGLRLLITYNIIDNINFGLKFGVTTLNSKDNSELRPNKFTLITTTGGIFYTLKLTEMFFIDSGVEGGVAMTSSKIDEYQQYSKNDSNSINGFGGIGIVFKAQLFYNFFVGIPIEYNISGLKINDKRAMFLCSGLSISYFF